MVKFHWLTGNQGKLTQNSVKFYSLDVFVYILIGVFIFKMIRFNSYHQTSEKNNGSEWLGQNIRMFRFKFKKRGTTNGIPENVETRRAWGIRAQRVSFSLTPMSSFHRYLEENSPVILQLSVWDHIAS
jgi:hypothetical protein